MNTKRMHCRILGAVGVTISALFLFLDGIGHQVLENSSPAVKWMEMLKREIFRAYDGNYRR